MKNKYFALLLIAMFCITLCSCGENENPVAPSSESGVATPIESGMTTSIDKEAQQSRSEPTETKPVKSESTKPEQTFPFKDDEGRMRYHLVINGHEVETENLPFTYPNEPKCGYYPLKDVLSYLGVECLFSEGESALTTKINGRVLKVTAGVAEMTYGPKTLKVLSDGPVCIDGSLYVPSVLFMCIFDNSIVDFTSDRSAATLETNTAINLAASGTAGLSVPNIGASGNGSAGNSPSGSGGKTGSTICGTCNGSGRSICTYCGGTGSKVEYQQTYDPISKQYKQTQRTVFCPRCGGSGRVTCPVCSGTGKK